MALVERAALLDQLVNALGVAGFTTGEHASLVGVIAANAALRAGVGRQTNRIGPIPGSRLGGLVGLSLTLGPQRVEAFAQVAIGHLGGDSSTFVRTFSKGLLSVCLGKM